MKPPQRNFIKFLTVCIAPAITVMSPQPSQAQGQDPDPGPDPKAPGYYWDENGVAPGFGTAGTIITNWSNSTSLFSADPSGSTAPTGAQLPGNLDNSFFGTSTLGMGGGTIQVSGNPPPPISNITFGSANTDSIQITGGQLDLGNAVSITITSNSRGNTISSVLTSGNQPFGLTVTGGPLTLTGANTFNRPVTVSGVGTKLSVASVGSVGSASSNLGAPTTAATATVNLIGGGMLSYTGTGETTNRILNLNSAVGSGGIVEQAGTGNLNFTGGVTSSGASSKTLTLQGSSVGTGEISGAIADNGGTNRTSILKSGSGTWTLSNNSNTYTGTTTVNQGKLIVNGSIQSAATVNSGGTLGGSGTIVNNVTVNGGGTLAPGTSPGLLTVSGDLILASGSIFSWELGSETTTGRGTNFDAVNVGGTLTVNDAIFKIIIPTLGLNTPFWSTSKGWSVFDKALATSSSFGSFSVFSASNPAIPISYSGGDFSYNNATGELYWVAAPEPSSALAAVLLAGGLMRRRRVP